jgi:hypothetical protein
MDSSEIRAITIDSIATSQGYCIKQAINDLIQYQVGIRPGRIGKGEREKDRGAILQEVAKKGITFS